MIQAIVKQRYLISLLLLILAIILDGQIDHVRKLGYTNYFLDCAPTLVSSLFIPTIILILGKFTKTSMKIALGYSFGAVIYEMLQDALGSGTTALGDIYAALVVCIFWLAVSTSMRKNQPNINISKKEG